MEGRGCLGRGSRVERVLLIPFSSSRLPTSCNLSITMVTPARPAATS